MPGPQFVKYFRPVVDALKELGNSGTPSEVREIIANSLHLTDDQLNDTMESGASRFQNQVAWARFYLNKAGYIASSKRGVWSLTEKGLASELTEGQALEVFHSIQSQFQEAYRTQQEEEAEDAVAPPDVGFLPTSDYRTALIEKVRSLSPSGFERLCQRLLRESGFQQVEVTGRSGDGGIDGKGILQVSPLLSFQVIFQCKRYTGSVTPSQIRDFRGAMMGRADKGIFLTTGTFTAEARREASRDGATPIELVDADKLIQMFEDLELGLVPKTTYEIDSPFFDEFV
jgi:restriction system protein